MKLLFSAAVLSSLQILASSQLLTWNRPFGDGWDNCGDACSSYTIKLADKIIKKGKVSIEGAGIQVPGGCDCFKHLPKCPDGISEGDPCGYGCCGEDCDAEKCGSEECQPCDPGLWENGDFCLLIDGKKWTEFWCNALPPSTPRPTPKPTPKPTRAPASASPVSLSIAPVPGVIP